MKKKIIYSSALAALLSASSIALAGGPEIIPVEDYFSGFYVGGFGAVHHVDMNGSSQVNLTTNLPANPIFGPPVLVPGTLINNDVSGASVDGYGGVQGGFGWTFNHFWYLGVVGWGEFGNQNSTSTSNSTPINPNILNILFNNTNIQNSTTTKISNDYGVAAKLGLVVAPQTMVYGKVGASWADVTVSNSTTATNSFSIKNGFGVTLANLTTTLTGGGSSEDNKVGLLLGLGAEQFVYQDWVSVFIEYNYTNYGTVSTGPFNLFGHSTLTTPSGQVFTGPGFTAPVTTQASSNATVDAFLGGINIYLGGRGLFGIGI